MEHLIHAVFRAMGQGMLLCTQDHTIHCLDRFDWIDAGSRFCREHHCIGTIENGVRNVEHFSTRWE
ncbi:hypothetical protein D3C81_2005380 [compost metagenome]